MLLVWLDQLDQHTRDHILRLDPSSNYWPRSQRLRADLDFGYISEWYVSFSRDSLGFQFVLAYPETTLIIAVSDPLRWRYRAV